MSRLPVLKTLKMYVGGRFIRSESGRVRACPAADGVKMYTPLGSRKDLRDAVRIARKAQAGWAARTAYNRGQILYRLAEMLEHRAASFPVPQAEVRAAADRALHHAGWSDKITAILSTLNPVANTFVNYSRIRPLGVVASTPAAADGLLGLIEAVCAPALMGSTNLVFVPLELSEVAIALAECLATSDWPAGVVNLLTGDPEDLVGHANAHDDLDGLVHWAGALPAEVVTTAEYEGARVIRRIVALPSAAAPAGPAELARLCEVQTVWMSAFEPRGGAAAY